MRPNYRQRTMDLLSNPQVRILDQGDVITFESGTDKLVFRMSESLCDLSIQGVQVARYFVHRYMLLVAMKRAIEDSL